MARAFLDFSARLFAVSFLVFFSLATVALAFFSLAAALVFFSLATLAFLALTRALALSSLRSGPFFFVSAFANDLLGRFRQGLFDQSLELAAAFLVSELGAV